MIRTNEKSPKISGTGSYLPEYILTNKELETIVDTTSQWIVERAGIHERRRASPHETASYMGTKAAREALEDAGVGVNDIEFILCATTTPDKQFPGIACMVQHALGCRPVPALDVQAACSGFLYALHVAENFIRSGAYKTILIVCSEVMTALVDWRDRATCVLFGDGAGAIVLTAEKGDPIFHTQVSAQGKYADLLYANNALPVSASPDDMYLQMHGREVFKLAVNTLEQIATETLEKHNVTHDDIDWLIPHQANIRIIQATAKKLKMDMSKVIITLNQHGNTSCASIPLALDEAIRSGKIKRDDLLLMEAFGAGLSWGTALIKY